MNALRYMERHGPPAERAQSFAGTETREQLDFVSRYEVKSSPAVVARGAWRCSAGTARMRYGTSSVPVLLIAGDRDTTTVPAASEYMKEKLGRSDLMLAAPAKHMGVVERNREYDESVREFANACFGRHTQSAEAVRQARSRPKPRILKQSMKAKLLLVATAFALSAQTTRRSAVQFRWRTLAAEELSRVGLPHLRAGNDVRSRGQWRSREPELRQRLRQPIFVSRVYRDWPLAGQDDVHSGDSAVARQGLDQ